MTTAQGGQEKVNKWGCMLAVGLSVFMSTLDVSIVNVSLPTIVSELETNFATIQWVILGYVLVVTSMTLSFARLGDIHGKKRLFEGGLTLFTLGSLMCGLSPSAQWLIGSRMVQGLGAAVLQALGAAIVTEAFPGDQRGRAMGIIGGTVSVGLATGPALGGVLLGAFGWRSIFLINIPVGAFAVWGTIRFVHAGAGEERKTSFDFLGALTMLFLTGAYALGMTLGQRRGFSGFPSLLLLFAAGGFLLIFIALEKRSRSPMIDLSLFRNALFSLNLLMGWLVFIVLSATFIIPFYLEMVKGYRPEIMGLMMMVVPVSMGIVAPAAGWLADRFGSRGVSLLGLIVSVAGCMSISSLDQDTGLIGVFLRLVPFGAGMGLFQSPNNSAIMGAVARNRLGVASGLMALSRTLGHTTGIPLAGTAFAAWVLASADMPGLKDPARAPAGALVHGLHYVYGSAALVIAGATVLAAAALVLDHKRKADLRRGKGRIGGYSEKK